jgi:Uncharacterized Fe-S protein
VVDTPTPPSIDMERLAGDIRQWGAALGFSEIGIAKPDLGDDEAHLLRWLKAGRHGTMRWMGRHGLKRARPERLVPGTLRVISVRMDYHPPDLEADDAVLADGRRAFIARYALGRDYHKLMRQRLQRLAEQIEQTLGPFGYRAFVDSGPVLEKALARNAGLGWIGKNTLLLNRHAGSYFSSASYSPICHCPKTNPSTISAAAVGPASMSARPVPSLALSSLMRDAVFPI